ncbi:hypothetical protein TanjilG_12275 [Lupinus angustifolius]|uniref:Uncharacterized protein n=1 Tax=Lupinus angustifolius TaxID=3871 RepID=A0A1J7IMC3_LUPAN|nr:PREDICTED: uncharacterized protein LOC109343351 [Lupinus angustifolius]OIW15421.1 hypothetical protein TanjilG_12275 [Lupinus angustifolius]
MASVPSSSPPPLTNPDASNSGHSPNNKDEGATNNGVFYTDEKKPPLSFGLDHLDSTQYIERFRKNDAEYTRRLMSKYFSGKSLYGGNIYEEQMTIGDEIIKSSRLPCFRSYTDLVVGFEEQCSNGSTPPADTQTSMSSGKHTAKKNS